MDKSISWRVIYDDGTSCEWEDIININGVDKRASIDDIDRDTVSQLITIDGQRRPIHVIELPKEVRENKRFVWRHWAGVTLDGQTKTIAALTGFNEKLSDGTEKLTIDVVEPDGTISSGEGMEVCLHPREIF